ncbi:MAG TPA: Zn-dependent alcohol dehydrogenase [Chloroflexota bacterium]|nr:Zn-dependent alcohol dehydrogenase [Chloroflexota bacterium]
MLAPRQGEVMVRMAASGVCGTDLHAIDGDLPLPLPCVLGHEGAGVVEEVGPGVTTLAPGDHVVLLWRASCGRCFYCSIGRPALCDLGLRIRQTGAMPDGETRFRRADGQPIYHFLGASTFSEYTVLPEAGTVKVRPDVPLDLAALVGCGVITGVGAVMNAARVEAGSAVAVFGAGGVGLNVIQGAALVGAERIVAVDTRQSKLDLARRFGATHTVDAAHEDAVAAIQELTGGRGADYAFEAIGLPSAMAQAVAAVRKAGTVVVVGLAPAGATVGIDALALTQQEKTLRGSLYGSARPRLDIPRLLDLYVAGKLKLEELVTRRYPLQDVNTAVEDLRRGEVARALLTMSP